MPKPISPMPISACFSNFLRSEMLNNCQENKELCYFDTILASSFDININGQYNTSMWLIMFSNSYM